MVLAVPMTMQVPAEGARRSFALPTPASSSVPARNWAQSRRQSVQAPRVSPLWWPTIIGPTGSTTAGTSALSAPMIWAGRVLSQPPMRRTESMGWARIISSVSIAIRLRRNMLVGWEKVSWRLMVGKTIGSAPLSITPRFAASRIAGMLPWQGLKSLPVSAMPTMGRASASSE